MTTLSCETPETQDHAPALMKILERHERRRDRLIPILQEVQEEFGYLPEEQLKAIAAVLDLPAAHVFGVATFYTHFALEARGKYVVKLCDGTACHVKASIPILEALQKRLGLSDRKKTSADALFTVETVACLGACGLAPVMVINEEVFGQMTPQRAVELVDELARKEGGAP